MASIKIAAQDVLDEARDGIAWIAVWKDGKGWSTMTFWPEYDERTNAAKMEQYEVEQLKNLIKNTDAHAVIVNSYVHNLGDTENMTRDSLADFLKWHYENGWFTVATFLDCVQIAQN